MRRLISSTLLSMLSFVLAAPLFATQSPETHACCHRTAKHHCESTQDASEPGISIHKLTEKCPCSSGSTVVQHARDFGARPIPAFRTTVLTRAAAIAQSRACYRISFSRSQQKRGPPVFFS